MTYYAAFSLLHIRCCEQYLAGTLVTALKLEHDMDGTNAQNNDANAQTGRAKSHSRRHAQINVDIHVKRPFKVFSVNCK